MTHDYFLLGHAERVSKAHLLIFDAIRTVLERGSPPHLPRELVDAALYTLPRIKDGSLVA